MQELSIFAARHWDVIVIGGGATGAGTLRDLAMRGVKALLLEQRDLVHGTSSRFHGLLHSGARYAVKDADAGRECIEENRILRRIGTRCVEETEGFFVRSREDGPERRRICLEAPAAYATERRRACSAYRPESTRGACAPPKGRSPGSLLFPAPFPGRNVPVGAAGAAELTVAGPRRSLTGLPEHLSRLSDAKTIRQKTVLSNEKRGALPHRSRVMLS